MFKTLRPNILGTKSRKVSKSIVLQPHFVDLIGTLVYWKGLIIYSDYQSIIFKHYNKNTTSEENFGTTKKIFNKI